MFIHHPSNRNSKSAFREEKFLSHPSGRMNKLLSHPPSRKSKFIQYPSNRRVRPSYGATHSLGMWAGGEGWRRKGRRKGWPRIWTEGRKEIHPLEVA